MNKAELLKELYVTQNYPKILNIIEQEKDPFFVNLKARVFFLMKNLRLAKEFYTLSNSIYELGYCFFIEGNFNKAMEVWQTEKKESLPLKWSKCITKLLTEEDSELPSYFQIRNFFELDIENFIMFEKTELANKMLALAPKLIPITPEVYKSAARVFINHKFYPQAIDSLKFFLDCSYKDPEARFALAKCYLLLGEHGEGLKELQKCLDLTSGYFPAIQELKKLNCSKI